MAEATQVANDQLIENEQVQNRIEKMHKLEERGILPFGHRFDWTHHNTDVHEHAKEMEEAGTEVKVAGRVMAIRGHGKTCFMDLHDKTGRIQLYLRKDVLGEDAYSVTRLMDIGDIIGVTGTVFLTHTGEPSIRVTDLQFLSKALKPLPEKFHGLKDMDLRYRQRYVDLIMNPEVKDVFVKRTQIIKSIRRILDEDGFLEVETPVLNTISGGATARPFITYHNALNIQLYLRIATELNLKRLIVGGMERVYELGRVFRNEGMDIKHNPEFTTLELYQAYGDMDTMMDITEKLVSQTAQNVLGTMKITYEGQEIDLTPPWPRMTMIDSIKEFSGYDFNGVKDLEQARAMAKEAKVEFEESWGVGKIINAFFDAFVEEKLVQPVFICQEQRRRSGDYGPFRRLHLRPRTVQRLYGTERSAGPARTLRQADGGARQRRPGSRHDGRGLRQCPDARPAPDGRPGYRHRPTGHVPDGRHIHPRRAAFPDHEAAAAGQGGTGRRRGRCRKVRGRAGGKVIPYRR